MRDPVEVRHTTRMLRWLFGRGTRAQAKNEMWLSRPDRLAGLRRAVEGEIAAGRASLIVAHFRLSLDAARTALAGVSGAGAELAGPSAAVQFLREAPAGQWRVAMAARLPETTTPGANPERLSVHTVEHHFIPAPDQRILTLAATCGLADVTFHSALDEPFLAEFGGAGMRDFYMRRGAQPDMSFSEWAVSRGRSLPFVQGLDHGMGVRLSQRVLGRAITAAQRKIERQAPTLHAAQSPEEWLFYNLPARQRS